MDGLGEKYFSKKGVRGLNFAEGYDRMGAEAERAFKYYL